MPVPFCVLVRRRGSQRGFASLIALAALSIFGLLALYMALGAATELRLADNFEAHTQATYAALAGLNHARVALRGVDPDDLLEGPDGTHDASPAYLARARTFGFRSLMDWTAARLLDLADPSVDVRDLPDDGLVNTGSVGGTPGKVLIPVTGVLYAGMNPYDPGTQLLARYFVKVTDNSGEASELAADPADDPFLDGDGTFIVRSIGVSQTIRENTGNTIRANSVVVYEGRYRQRRTFDLDAPLVLQGTAVLPASTALFAGNTFAIAGGPTNPGIATVDPDTTDASIPGDQVISALAPDQRGSVQGLGLSPSVMDVTASLRAETDKGLVLDPVYLDGFARTAPQFADTALAGNQSWSPAAVPDLGSYDWAKPYNDPAQNPKVVAVDGDVAIDGSLSGGGLLVIRGKLSGRGALSYTGLILLIGAGEVDLQQLNLGLRGGMYLGGVSVAGGIASFSPVKITVGGGSTLTLDRQAIRMGVRLIPPSQLGIREVNGVMDP